MFLGGRLDLSLFQKIGAICFNHRCLLVGISDLYFVGVENVGVQYRRIIMKRLLRLRRTRRRGMEVGNRA